MGRGNKHAGARAVCEISSANPEVVSKPKLFDASIVSGPRGAVHFIPKIFESSTEDSVIGKDLEGSIFLWNEGARRIYGYEPKEAVGKVTGVPRDTLIGTDSSNYFSEAEQAREGCRQIFAMGSITDCPLTIRHTL